MVHWRNGARRRRRRRRRGTQGRLRCRGRECRDHRCCSRHLYNHGHCRRRRRRRRTAAAFTIALAAVAVAVPLAVAAADVVAATAAVLWPPRSHFAAMEMIMAHLQLVNVLQSHFPGYCRKWQPGQIHTGTLQTYNCIPEGCRPRGLGTLHIYNCIPEGCRWHPSGIHLYTRRVPDGSFVYFS